MDINPEELNAALLRFYDDLDTMGSGRAMMLYDDTILRNLHPETACMGHGCWVHHPSPHRLAYAPVIMTNTTPVRALRICEHQAVHQDPDELAFLYTIGHSIPADHDCDGCCEGELPSLPDHERYELGRLDTGTWEVTTEESTHLFDLTERTWTRHPGNTANTTEADGLTLPIDRFGTYPMVERRTLLWYRDLRGTNWALSTPVVRIAQVDAGAAE